MSVFCVSGGLLPLSHVGGQDGVGGQDSRDLHAGALALLVISVNSFLHPVFVW